MPNTFITPTWVTKEVARYWLNSLKFAANVNRDYDDQYMQAGAKVGYTVNARLPQRFVPTEGQALQQQAILNQTVPISLTHQKNVAFGWSSADATMIVEDVRKRYVMPAAEALANIVDADGTATVFPYVYNSIGTPGTANTTNLAYLQGVAKLYNNATPTPFVACLDPNSMVQLVNANLTLFNPSAAISEEYRSGQFGRNALGVSAWYQDQNIARYTTGSFTSCTPLVDGGGQTGPTININGWASGATTLRRGDIISIAGVYSVNPISYVSTGELQQFVITADTSDVTGVTATLPISPSIITSGQLQTVTASPVNDAKVYVVGSTITTGAGAMVATVGTESMIYNEDAFALVMADLKQPSAGAQSATVRSKELAISIRMVEQYNIQTDQEPSRFDILYGWAAVLPYFAVRMQS